MLTGILQGLVQWIYGLFLDLISYCANALLDVMSTDLEFFETSVPIVPSLYKIFVAVGWGLLIGNMAFQSMKAMFAGFGIETESPYILMLRTFLFGTLLIFSKDICDIGLSISKNVIDLLGIPDSVTITMPTEAYFSGNSSWLLVIIIGFILGFQLIKLFFEIAERYVVVAVLTLLMPMGLAMGGSKSTKDICSGYMRMYASMLVLMVTNVLFLKLILSALAAMPTGTMVLPWCLLIVGLAKTARKTDELIARIGMNPAMTGDPLGRGRGLMTTLIVARTIMAARRNGAGTRNNTSNGNNVSGNNAGSYNQKTAANTVGNKVYNGGPNNVNRGNNSNSSFSNNETIGNAANNTNMNNNNHKQTGFSTGGNSSAKYNSYGSSRFGTASYNSAHQSGNGFSTTVTGGAGTGSKINTNRFGIQKDNAKVGASVGTKGGAAGQQNGTNQQIQKSKTAVKSGNTDNRRNRFGSTPNNSVRHNPNPMKQTGKSNVYGAQNTNNIAPNGKGVMPDKVRFGSERIRRMTDDDILITRDDDNDV